MKARFFVLLIMLVLLLNGCAPAAAPTVSQNGILVSNVVILSDAGAMSSMDMGQSFAGYLQIKNSTATDDQLVGVTCDFADLMLHGTSITGDVASMKEISRMDVPAGATVEFKTGGIHLMFMNLKQDLKVGDTVNLILKFKNAGEITVKAIVTAR